MDWNDEDDQRYIKLLEHVTTFAAHVTQLRLTVHQLNHTVELLMELCADQNRRIKRLEEQEQQQHGTSTDDVGPGNRRDHPSSDRVELGSG